MGDCTRKSHKFPTYAGELAFLRGLSVSIRTVVLSHWELSLLSSTPLLTFWVILVVLNGARWSKRRDPQTCSNKIPALTSVCPQMKTNMLAQSAQINPGLALSHWPRWWQESPGFSSSLTSLLCTPGKLSHEELPGPARCGPLILRWDPLYTAALLSEESSRITQGT